MRRLILAAAVLAACMGLTATADERTDSALQTSQDVIGTTLPDLTFRDIKGKQVSLADFSGKPLLITLIYTGCADVCPTIIESLVPAVTAGQELLGETGFNVLTVGFDTKRDTPERMRAFAASHNAGGANWHFVSSDKPTMDRLTSAVGFSYFASVGGFDHMSQITVVDKTGTIYQQVYGSNFEPPAIVGPLKDLVFGRQRSAFSLQGLGDRLKLFCSVYNPVTGRYYFNYALLASIIIGAGCLIGTLVFLIREVRKSMRPRGV